MFRYTFTRLHGVTSYKIVVFIVTSVSTSHTVLNLFMKAFPFVSHVVLKYPNYAFSLPRVLTTPCQHMK
jgi:hypothetical protein